MNKVHSYEAITARVRDLQAKRANLSSQVTEKDPNEQGTVTVPKGEGEDPAPQNLPANRKEITTGGNLGVMGGTDTPPGAGPTGTAVPSTVDGQPKDDAATSPTTALSKIATDAASIGARIASLRKSASAPATAVAATPAPAAEKGIAPELGTDMMFKLAAAMLETEEGRVAAEAALLKSAGAEAARTLLASAGSQYDALVQNQIAWDEYQKSAAFAENQELLAAEELLKSASAEEREEILKIARVHPAVLATIPDEMEKMAYQQGAMDAAQMEASAAPGPDGEPTQEPALEGGQEGGVPSLEQIAQMLMAAVEAGEIPEEVAMQVMQELAQAGGGEGGAPAGDPAAGGAPAGLEPAPEGGAGDPAGAPEPDGDELPPEAKAASALCANLIPELSLL
jgi:hypothetical protein